MDSFYAANFLFQQIAYFILLYFRRFNYEKGSREKCLKIMQAAEHLKNRRMMSSFDQYTFNIYEGSQKLRVVI
jgi:hypothetical protein